jgi:hypothetical protein
MLWIVLLSVLYIIGLYFYATSPIYQYEGFQNPDNCPNVLIQNGSRFYLYNTRKHDVPGINPIVFENLEQYVEYTVYLKNSGQNCPILYLQKINNAQGDDVYKVREDPQNPQGGTPPPPPTDQTPYDYKMYMDNLAQTISQNLSVGEIRNINKLALTKSVLSTEPAGCEKMPDSIKPFELQGLSADPMEPNWGGPEFTQSLIDQGYYAGNEVNIYVP